MKKIPAFLFILLMIFAGSVCVHAAEFQVLNSSLPRGEAHTPYEAKIQMSDDADYTFEFADSSILPGGITLSSDGTISGTPTSSGYYKGIYVRITCGEESRVVQFYLRLSAMKINVEIEAENTLYDGEKHYASYKVYDAKGKELNDVEPIIRYGNSYATYAQDAGIYPISVFAPAGYLILEPVLGDTEMEIYHLSVNSLTVDDYSVPYSGSAQAMPSDHIHVNPEAAGYAIEYRKSGESSYSSAAPSASGTYTVRAHTTNPNYETVYAEATLTIVAQGVNFNINNTSVPYDGKNHGVSVSSDTPDAEYTISYTDSEGNTVAGEPKNAGTYTATVNLKNPDKYSITSGGSAAFEIKKQSVKVIADETSYEYDGTSHTPDIHFETAPDPTITFDYVLHKQGENTPEDLKAVTAVGTYDVVITLSDTDNYSLSSDSVSEISVSGATVSFTADNLSYTYDKKPHTADITPSASGFNAYTVTYTGKNSKQTVSEPVDADEYTISITSQDSGYGIGSITPNTLTIAPNPLTFSVSGDGVNSEVDYDKNPHGANVTAMDKDNNTVGADGVYTVQYKDGEGNISGSAPVDKGEYTVVITVTNSNYKRSDDDTATYTISIVSNISAALNYGNSPAAQIMLDTAASHDDSWKQSAIENLKTNRSFGSYVPTGLDGAKDISYTLIDGVDIDSDPATLILSDISQFAEADTGMKVDGVDEVIKGSEPVENESIEGLYIVTYTYEDISLTRYVAVIGRIGDVNANTAVNALDANAIDKALADADAEQLDPATVAQARMWDVNKDGKITNADSQAIRVRFTNPLRTYYPWI